MNFLLDTNAVIAILKNDPPSVRRRFAGAKAQGGRFAVSSIVLYELRYGVAKSLRRAENEHRLQIFLSGDLDILAFDDEDAAIAGDVRAELEAIGRPIGPYDLLIAAQALRSKATLITANVGEFSRVPGLTWQNWSAER